MNLISGRVVEFIYNGATFIGMATRGGIQTEDFFVNYRSIKPLRIWDAESSFYYLNKMKQEIKPLYQYHDWEKVEVDTPITLVSIDGSKHYAHFAKWEDNKIHLWTDGRTSHTTYTTCITSESEWKEVIVGDKK
jgi:hypothetical protein|nr:MAG TPA: hypothetical protein [Inoviridae sp.]